MSLRKQAGATLFAMLAVVALAGSAYLASRLQALAGDMEAAKRAHNAAVLKQAKGALLGYVAALAAQSGENHPGRLPCPEAGSHVGSSDYEGRAALYPGGGSSSCVNIGRLPWRTIGASQLRDAAGEPLWYAVTVGSTGWALQTSSTALVINSDKDGGLSVDGQANAAVAVIIAPGAAMTVAPTAAQTAAGCSARTQNRSTTPPNYLDYLECHNLGANSVVTSVIGNAPNAAADGTTNTVFNDQVIAITAAEIMAVVEPIIAKRIENQIAPVLKAIYATSTWNRSTASPLFPYAVPFGNPATSNYRGVAGTYQGLLPFNYTGSGTACTNDVRCSVSGSAAFTINDGNTAPTVTKVSGSGTWSLTSCNWSNASVRWRCSGRFDNNDGGTATTLTMSTRVLNAAFALRTLDQKKLTVEYRTTGAGPYTSVTCGNCLTAAFNADGSVTVTAQATLPDSGNGNWYWRIAILNTPLADHALLDSTDGTTGWFVRNEWYRLVYYAVTQKHTASTLPAPLACTAGTDCLSVTNTTPSNNKRAILILAGRSMSGAARPNALLGDYLEFGNADGNTTFEQQPVTRPLSTVLPDTGVADAYVVGKDLTANGPALFLKAANANTGLATLRTATGSARALVNADGSNLAASRIAANAVLQISFDGTNYVLSSRPFNDRVIVIDAN
ncbi:MAG: hypothetical protein ACT4P4_11555 [Betaproteobacteria bacterium]